MLEPQSTFGECLEELMHTKGLSTQRLAELAGYKSKTSIARILKEESVHAGRERLFHKMDALGLLTEQERRNLTRALETSRLGKRRAAARLRLRRLLTGAKTTDTLDQELAQCLERLRAAHAAQILLVICYRPALMERLGEILAQRPAHTLEHFVSIGSCDEQMMEVLCAVLSLAYLRAYTCAARDTGSEWPAALPGCEIMCFTAQNRDGASTDTLVIFESDGKTLIHTQPASQGLFGFLKQAVDRQGYRQVIESYKQQESPESFVTSIRFCTELERSKPACIIKPGLCLNEVASGFLRAALLEGGVLRYFPEWTEQQVRMLLEEFLYFHARRFENSFYGVHARRQIMSPRSLRRFALTGRFDAPFLAIRAFTVRERVAILEHFERAMDKNGGFSMRLWSEESDFAMEVHCFENTSILAVPAELSSSVNAYYPAITLRHSRLAALFTECFEDDLLRNSTLSAQESLGYISGLLDELRATL